MSSADLHPCATGMFSSGRRASQGMHNASNGSMSVESPFQVQLLMRTDERLRSIADTQQLQAKEISDLRHSIMTANVRAVYHILAPRWRRTLLGCSPAVA